jgi:hypothetical protein
MHIVKCSINKDTKVFVFSSTHESDDAYVEFKKWAEEKEIEAVYFHSLMQEGVNILAKIVETINQNPPDEEPDEEEHPDPVVLFNENDIRAKIKKKKKKVIAKFLFIFDDIGNELRNKAVEQLVKINRHLKSKVIISSQYPNDLALPARNNINIWILFGGHNLDKLEEIYKIGNFSVTFTEFLTLYYDATKEKYNFLFINRNDNTYRKNFNLEYKI